MSRSPSDRILDEWDDLTRHAPRPDGAPYRRGVRAGGSLLGLAPLLAAAVVVAIGIGWLGTRESGPVGTDDSPAPSAIALAPTPSAPAPTVAPSPSPLPATPEPTVRPSASPVPPTAKPTPSPTPAGPNPACIADELHAAVVSWEGAAGSRIATVRLTNVGHEACLIPAMSIPALVDGDGRILAQGLGSLADGAVTLEPGASVGSQVAVANVCGQPPVAPVTVAFDLQTGTTITATPLTPTDVDVPPCNGPGQPASITMHPWSN
jgi:hypothetical protein